MGDGGAGGLPGTDTLDPGSVYERFSGEGRQRVFPIPLGEAHGDERVIDGDQ